MHVGTNKGVRLWIKWLKSGLLWTRTLWFHKSEEITEQLSTFRERLLDNVSCSPSQFSTAMLAVGRNSSRHFNFILQSDLAGTCKGKSETFNHHHRRSKQLRFQLHKGIKLLQHVECRQCRVPFLFAVSELTAWQFPLRSPLYVMKGVRMGGGGATDFRSSLFTHRHSSEDSKSIADCTLVAICFRLEQSGKK